MKKISERPISAAVLGCGKIAGLPGFAKEKGRVFTHLPAYRYFENVRVIAACDHNKKQLYRFCDFYKIRNGYTDYRKMLKNESIDILSICTPAENHYPAIKEAVLSGVKYILCEKPLAYTVDDVGKIIKICNDGDVFLIVNYLRRYHPEYKKLKRFIEDRRLGEVKRIHCLYTKGILNNGSHLLDLLLFLFGEIDYVYEAKRSERKGEFYDIESKLYFKKGWECLIQPMSFLNYSIFEIDIFLDKGRIIITDSARTIIIKRMGSSKEFFGYRVLSDYRKMTDCTEMGMVPVIADLVSIMHKDKRPRMDPARDNLFILKVIHAMWESSSKNGKKIPIYKSRRQRV